MAERTQKITAGPRSEPSAEAKPQLTFGKTWSYAPSREDTGHFTIEKRISVTRPHRTAS